MKAIIFILATATMLSAAMTAVVYGNTAIRILGLVLIAVIMINLIILALMKGD